MQLNEPEREKLDRQALLAVGEAREAVFCPTSGLKDSTFGSSWFSAEGTVITASVMPNSRETAQVSPFFFPGDLINVRTEYAS